MMVKLQIDVPDELAGALLPYQDRVDELILLGVQQLKIAEALLLYARGVVSFARAVELAGISRTELIRQARAAGVVPCASDGLAASGSADAAAVEGGSSGDEPPRDPDERQPRVRSRAEILMLQRMLAEGLISEIKPPLTVDPDPTFTPIGTRGKPLSEMIIEERR